MNSQLKYISLATILDYHERFLESCEKESTIERKETNKRLKSFFYKNPEIKRPFIGLFQ
jgi:hypothetical protein